jgi:lysophospholipase L1-like esterase
MAAEDIAAFNRVFGPHVEILVLRIPRPLTFDGLHLTVQGSKALAEALARYERTTQDSGR